MVVIGIGQIIAAILLTISGIYLYYAEMWVLAVIDIVAGAVFFTTGIQNRPPDGV